MEVFEGSFRGASRLPVAITMIKKAVSRRENFSMGKRFSTPGYSLVSLGEVFFFFFNYVQAVLQNKLKSLEMGIYASVF